MIRALQVLWGLGVAAWNFYGMYQLEHGSLPPGPTSSYAVALAGLAIALLFWGRWLEKWPCVYITLCLICAVMAGFIVYGSLTKDPSLWPSEAWRWGGIILNSTGAFACFLGIAGIFQGTKKMNY